MFRSAKPKAPVVLQPWNMVVLGAAGFWVLIVVDSLTRWTSAVIAHFRFGPVKLTPAELALQIPRAKLIAMQLEDLPWWLALGAWFLITGACLAAGVRRYPVGRGAGILTFLAGSFMFMSAFPFTKMFAVDALETPLTHWLMLGIWAMGGPWLLGRIISCLSSD